MATNQVVLTFAGDATPLSKTFTQVGSDATTMSSKVDTASKNVGGGFDRMGEGADRGEQRITGLRDSITGTGDVMKGFAEGDIALVLTGFADLASGAANFVVPALKALVSNLSLAKIGAAASAVATGALTAAQTALNVVLSLNPIGLVVIALAALVAGFILAWKHSETFRNVVRGAMDSVAGAVEFVLDRFRGLWEFIRDLPGRIANALRGVATTITNMIPGTGIVKSIIDKIPGFQMGGMVGGPLGAPQLAVVHGGERVLRPGEQGGQGPIVVQLVVDGRKLAEVNATNQRQNQRRGFAA